jgi:hypothetical protein
MVRARCLEQIIMTTATRRWVPLAEIWEDFCKNDLNGQTLGLKGNENSRTNLCRKHAKRLEELDVIRRSPANNRIIADADRFGPVVFDLLTTGKLPDESAAAAA